MSDELWFVGHSGGNQFFVDLVQKFEGLYDSTLDG
jgi:hypothetical protein